jgi:hypothetical protein
MKLLTKGTPVWNRPGLGIGKEDVRVDGNTVTVRVHSLGSVDAPAKAIAIIGVNGKAPVSVTVPALKAPIDLLPRTVDVKLTVPNGTALHGSMVTIDPENRLKEISRLNNRIEF